MIQKFKVIDCDIIYLSYDEPNAEKNYADLLTKVPWAKRVHGVEGSDAAHKACARLSETDQFITVDGDNIIDQKFLDLEIEFQEHVELQTSVISWSAKNSINDLMYGNGGIKCWPKQHVLNMRTHENADPNNIAAQVDFCWDLNYIQQNTAFSTIHNNATPHQAWRAGFREGVKMCLNQGEKPSIEQFINGHKRNLQRLYIWLMVGADVKNGDWAILGARAGLYKTMCTDWDFVNVRDFEYLNSLWNEEFVDFEGHNVYDEIVKYGSKLKQELTLPISVNPFDSQQSAFFKSIYVQPLRTSDLTNIVTKSNYDMVLISYQEPNADANYEKLKKKFPRIQRVNGVKGIHAAHKAAAELCNTPMMWVIDADADVVDNFKFDYNVNDHDQDCVFVWHSKNPINDLEYGYGGIKLFPTKLTQNMDMSKPDMTTSISSKFKKMEEVSCVTRFNTDEFSTWRSAFRECCKLSSKIIDRQKSNETDARLAAWCSNIGRDRPFGDYAISGARAGRKYGVANQGNIDALKKINDFDWLKEKFNEC